MERELKFRAWHPISKEMIYPRFSKNAGGLDSLSSGDLLNKFDSDDLMQYVGRCDINDKDIYEDDWCRAKFRDKNGIIQSVEGWIFMDEFMWCLDNSHAEPIDGIYSINRLHDLEVLFNKYEIPERLSIGQFAAIH